MSPSGSQFPEPLYNGYQLADASMTSPLAAIERPDVTIVKQVSLKITNHTQLQSYLFSTGITGKRAGGSSP